LKTDLARCGYRYLSTVLKAPAFTFLKTPDNYPEVQII